MSMLAIIPARRDSKRCPGKNTRLLGQVPLIDETLFIVYQISDVFKSICIATDDDYIIQSNKNNKVFDVIKLPDYLTQEITDSGRNEFGFIDYVLKQYKTKGIEFDDVAIFYPTTPFKQVDTIKDILKVWRENRNDYQCLRTVKRFEKHITKFWECLEDDEIINPLIDGTLQFIQVPYCYIYREAKLNKYWHFDLYRTLKYEINDPIESHDINTEFDFKIAEWIVKDKLNEQKI